MSVAFPEPWDMDIEQLTSEQTRMLSLIEALSIQVSEHDKEIAILRTELALKTKRINDLSRVTEVVMPNEHTIKNPNGSTTTIVCLADSNLDKGE